jgi:hypothetical protein
MMKGPMLMSLDLSSDLSTLDGDHSSRDDVEHETGQVFGIKRTHVQAEQRRWLGPRRMVAMSAEIQL